VHGQDIGAREAVARFLDGIGFQSVILHEQANGGRTVIETVEANSDVGFAVVLLTPDDVGGLKDGTLEPRPRQNVILELGYFIGKLGRSKVCALKRGDMEIPSELAVVWETMDNNGAWKQALARELQAAGHVVEWNKVMR
jgi:predicted nucleotide-binding protein